MTRLALLIALGLSTCTFAQTQPTTQPIDPAAVAALVKELGADDAAARDAARQQLLAMGLNASAHLEKALADAKDPDVRTSLETIIADLPKYDRSVPTIVTIKLNGVPAKAAIDVVMQQAGVSYGTWPDDLWRYSGKTDVTIDAKQQPFWKVMTEICCQAGVSPESHGSIAGSRITLSQSSPRKVPPAWSGEGFHVTVRNASRTHSIPFEGDGKRTESFSLGLRMLADPRLRVLRGARGVIVTEAVDEKGNSLLPKNQMRNLEDSLDEPSFGCTWLWDTSASLTYLPQQGQILKSFKASALFEVIEKEETWEVEIDKAAKAEKTFNDTTIIVEALEKQGENYRLKLALKWKEPMVNFGGRRRDNPLRNYHSLQPLLKLVDAKGNPWRTNGGGGGGGNGKASFEFNYSRMNMNDQAGDPVKLILTAPTATRKIELPIEFKDLPIP